MKKLIKKLTWNSFLCIVVCLFVGCSAGKQTSVFKQNKVNNFTQAYHSVTTNNLPKQLKIKYKVSAHVNDKIKNLSGTIKYLNDSVLWLNIVSKAIGIEALRVKCTPDTLFFIDRINKRYYSGTYDISKNLFGVKVDFYFLRSILLGKTYGLAFSYKPNNINLFEQKQLKGKQFYFNYNVKNISKEDYSQLQNPNINSSFTVDKNGLLINNTYEHKANFLKIQISDYKYNNRNLPQTFTIQADKKTNSIKLQFTYTEYSTEDFNIHYKVPKSYKLIK